MPRHESRAAPLAALPSFRFSEYVLWSLSSDGRFTSAFGAGLECIGMTPADFVGRHVAEVHEARPDIIRMFQRMLHGQHVRETVEFRGEVWMVEGGPCVDGGATGIAFVLEKAPPEPEPIPCLGFDVYESAGDNARLDVWGADRWYVPVNPAQPGVFQVRYRMRGDFERCQSDDPDRMHVISRSPRLRPALRLLD